MATKKTKGIEVRPITDSDTGWACACDCTERKVLHIKLGGSISLCLCRKHAVGLLEGLREHVRF